MRDKENENREALIRHIDDLQAVIRKRNAHIKDLEDALLSISRDTCEVCDDSAYFVDSPSLNPDTSRRIPERAGGKHDKYCPPKGDCICPLIRNIRLDERLNAAERIDAMLPAVIESVITADGGDSFHYVHQSDAAAAALGTYKESFIEPEYGTFTPYSDSESD